MGAVCSISGEWRRNVALFIKTLACIFQQREKV